MPIADKSYTLPDAMQAAADYLELYGTRRVIRLRATTFELKRRALLEASASEGWNTYVGGQCTYALTCPFDEATRAAIHARYESNADGPFVLELRDRTIISVWGRVRSYLTQPGTDASITLDVTREPKIILGTSSIVNTVKEPRMSTKIRNKFYVGHPKMDNAFEQDQDNDPKTLPEGALASGNLDAATNRRWTRKNFKDAVAHAEQILEANPRQERCVVVKIIATVRRKKAPIVVETVK